MPFDLQGHRGARGLKPENTLPAFEIALDIGVSTIETDVHLTRDGVPVLCHDAILSAATISPSSSAPPTRRISQLTLEELRRFRANRNPDPMRFPEQDNRFTPVAELFARQHGFDPYAVPTVVDFTSFVAAYAGTLGEQSAKTDRQRERARRLRFDLELKRVPFAPDAIGDDFDGTAPGLLERRIVEVVRQAGVVDHTIIRSFDHRCVRAILQLEPRLTGAVLIAGTAPVSPVSLTRDAEATIYCADYRFVDEAQIRELHAAGLKIIPWTVSRPEDWQRLVSWGVDGITTDYPDRLALWLEERGIEVL